jgi:septal ring factor EnvC (AmiA/AmiB activator)
MVYDRAFGLLFENEDQLAKLIEEVNQELRKRAQLVSEIERSKAKNNNMQVNQKEKEKEVKKVKQLLDDMLDFLAEMPVDKYHDYREFRNLRLRQYLIYNFMRDKYSGQAAL